MQENDEKWRKILKIGEIQYKKKIRKDQKILKTGKLITRKRSEMAKKGGEYSKIQENVRND